MLWPECFGIIQVPVHGKRDFSCTDLRICSLILAFFSWRQAGAACSLYFLTYTSFVHVYVVEFLSLHVCLRGMEDLIFGQAIDDLS